MRKEMHKKIDNLFLNPIKKQPINLDECIENIKAFEIPLNNQIKKIQEIKKIINDDSIRLKNLNEQISSLNFKNKKLETILKNKKNLYSELKEILMKIEVKQKNYMILEELELKEENIEKFEEALFNTEILKEKLKLKIIKERNLTCEKYRNIYKKRFQKFFKNLLENLIIKSLKEKKNNYDLKLNTTIYALRKYKNLCIYKESLRNIYALEIGKLYYSNFKYFFRKMADIFKEDFNSLEDILSTILLICKCEIEFFYEMFLEEKEISLASEINAIFGESIPLFFIFLEEIYLLNEFKTLKEIKKIKNKAVIENKAVLQNKAVIENEESIFKDLESKYKTLEEDYKKKLIKNREIGIKLWSEKVKEFMQIIENEKNKKELKEFSLDFLVHYKEENVQKEILLIRKYLCIKLLNMEKERESIKLFNELEKSFIECLIDKRPGDLRKIGEEIKGIKEKKVQEKLKNIFIEFVKNDKNFNKKEIPKWIFN